MEACPPCLQEVLGQLRKETAKVGKGGDEMVFAYVTALTAGLINRSCYDEEAWKEVGQELLFIVLAWPSFCVFCVLAACLGSVCLLSANSHWCHYCGAAMFTRHCLLPKPIDCSSALCNSLHCSLITTNPCTAVCGALPGCLPGQG